MNYLFALLLAAGIPYAHLAAVKPSTTEASNVVINPSLAELKKHLTSKTLVIIDVQAHWCGSCKMFKPVFEKVAQDKNLPVVFIMIDHDKKELLNYLTTYKPIKAVPTVFFFKDGKVVESFVGAKNEQQFRTLIKQNQDSKD